MNENAANEQNVLKPTQPEIPEGEVSLGLGLDLEQQAVVMRIELGTPGKPTCVEWRFTREEVVRHCQELILLAGQLKPPARAGKSANLALPPHLANRPRRS